MYQSHCSITGKTKRLNNADRDVDMFEGREDVWHGAEQKGIAWKFR